jgi:hypothetical protein
MREQRRFEREQCHDGSRRRGASRLCELGCVVAKHERTSEHAELGYRGG